MCNNNYQNLTATELRELFFKKELNLDSMGIDEYEKLFGGETDSADPNGDVISFCVEGLNQYEKYNRVTHTPPFEEILKKHYRSRAKEIAFKIVKKTSVAAVIAITVVSLTQIVALALGFDIIEYVFNWFNKDTVEIISTKTFIEDDTEIFVEYDKISDIDNVLLSRVSSRILDEFDFESANYRNWYGAEKLELTFIDENEKFLKLIISDSPVNYIEKDDEGTVEEIDINGITYTIFTNMSEHQVIWEYDGYLYHLATFLPLEMVMEIIENYY